MRRQSQYFRIVVGQTESTRCIRLSDECLERLKTALLKANTEADGASTLTFCHKM